MRRETGQHNTLRPAEILRYYEVLMEFEVPAMLAKKSFLFLVLAKDTLHVEIRRGLDGDYFERKKPKNGENVFVALAQLYIHTKHRRDFGQYLLTGDLKADVGRFDSQGFVDKIMAFSVEQERVRKEVRKLKRMI